MKVLLSVVVASLMAAVLIVAASVALIGNHRSDMPPRRTVHSPALKTARVAAWGHAYPAIDLHPTVRPGMTDTTMISRVSVELPADMVEHGGTLHFLVTQPEWAVFDERGVEHAIGDEVVVAALLPDVGIGMELTRLVINAKRKPEHRRWHELQVAILPCTRRIGLEVLAGTSPESTNAFDNVWVSAREPLAFRNDARGSSDRSPCPAARQPGKCNGEAVPPQCAAASPGDGVMKPMGSLNTGAHRR